MVYAMSMREWFVELPARFGIARAPKKQTAASASPEYPWADTARSWSDQEWLQKAKDCASLRIPLARITSDVAAVNWRMFRIGAPGPDGRPSRTEVLNHPFLALWNKPNPFMTGISFRELWQHYLLVLGRVPIRVEYTPGTSQPQALWPIPPHTVKKFPDEGRPFWEIIWKKKTLQLEPHELIWVTSPDPEDPYGWGVGVCQAVKDDVSQISWMNQWSNNFFRLGGHIGKIIQVPGLNETNRGAIQTDFTTKHTGVENAHKVLFIASDKGAAPISVADLGAGHKDLDWVEGQKFLGDRIRLVMGVPPEVVGDVENSNRATAEAADYIHQSKNVRPQVQKMAAEINRYIQVWYGDPSIVLEPDEPVKETSDQRHQFAEDGWRGGAISRNEWRSAHNMDPLEDPLGNQILIPYNVVPVDPDGNYYPAPPPEATSTEEVPE